MKICMVAYTQYSRDARVQAYVTTVEKLGGTVDVLALREQGKKGFEQVRNSRIFYLTNKYQGSNPFLYLLSYLAFFLRVLLRISYLGIKERYSTVHVHNMPNCLIFAVIIPRFLGARVILDVHDLMPVTYMAKFNVAENSIFVRCLQIEQRISAAMASHVLCADHMQKQYLESVCKLENRKVAVIMNLPNDQIYRSTKKPKSDHNFRLVYHGTVARRLGIDIMLRAMARIGPEIPVHLSIYGSGDYLEEAVQLADKLCLDGRVYFSRSFFPAEMIPEMVSGMDLGIIGNRRSVATDRFMMPVKLLEYVYFKIPVVAPRLAVIKLYFDEDMVRYYEPENVEELAKRIVELYRSPKDRDCLVRNASRFYETHSWKAQAQEYVRLLGGI